MPSRSSRHNGLISAEALAGWIFADIMIVLFLVGLGSAAPPEIPSPTPRRTLTPAPKRIVGMRTHSRISFVSYDTGALLGTGGQARSARRSVCRQVRRATRRIGRQRAALVLAFGGGRDIGVALASARAVSRGLRCANPALFKQTVVRPFWDGDLPSGRARLEVFLFITS
jgi:hypothetical protein